MLFIYLFFEVIMVLLGVVFVTLFERKILGLIQFRLGPNKMAFKGLFQSLSDALKLFSKTDVLLFFISFLEYNFLPLGMMFVMMMLWMLLPTNLFSYSNGVLMMLCVFSVGVYPIMYGSWFSGSYYSMMGAIRSIAQMVSYEVSFIMIIMSFMFFTGSFDLSKFWGWGLAGVYMMMWMLLMMLFSSILVELGRTPADLLEGESELVSGFNTEFFGLKFAMIFMAEYGMIMFMGGLFSTMCLGLKSFSMTWGISLGMLVVMVYWIRGALPRIRYDKLMSICWISMLNLSLGFLIITVGYLSVW